MDNGPGPTNERLGLSRRLASAGRGERTSASTRLNYNLHLRKYLVVQGSWVRVKPSNARAARRSSAAPARTSGVRRAARA